MNNPPKVSPHGGSKRYAEFKAYIDFAWDEDLDKFVGIGIGFVGYVYTTEKDETKLEITDCNIDDHPECIKFRLSRS